MDKKIRQLLEYEKSVKMANASRPYIIESLARIDMLEKRVRELELKLEEPRRVAL